MIKMNYAVIDSTGLIVNVVVWDGITPWEPPAGHSVVQLTEGDIGWTVKNGDFIPPEE